LLDFESFNIKKKITDKKSQYSAFVKEVIFHKKAVTIVFYNVPNWKSVMNDFHQMCITKKIIDIPEGMMSEISIDRAFDIKKELV
jgi:hypothetical protein